MRHTRSFVEAAAIAALAIGVACFVPDIIAHAADPCALVLELRVDGARRGTIAACRVDRRVYASIESLGGALRVPVLTRGASRRVLVGEIPLDVTPGRTVVHDESGDALHLSAAPIAAHGRVFVEIHDLMSIFGALIDVDGNVLLAQSPDRRDDHTVREVHLAPRSVATLNAQDMRRADDALPARGVAAIRLDLSSLAGVATHTLTLMSTGSANASMLAFSGGTGSPEETQGTITVGSAQRRFIAGQVDDPLAGPAEHPHSAAGVVASLADGRWTIAHAVRDDGTMATEADERIGGEDYRIAHDPAHGFSIGERRTFAAKNFAIDRDVRLTQHGIMTGLRLRTNGRLQVAVSNTSLDLATAVRPWLYSRVGYTSNLSGHGGLYAGLSVRRPGFSVSGDIARGRATALISSASPTHLADFSYFRQDGNAVVRGDARLRVGAHELGFEIEADRPNPYARAAIEWRPPANRTGAIAGLEAIRFAGRQRIGPVAGVRLALGPVTGIDVTSRPGPTGRRFALAIRQTIRFAPKSRRIATPFELGGSADADLVCDGQVIGRFHPGVNLAQLSAGDHLVFARLPDGRAATPIVHLVAGNQAPALFTPLPLRRVRGTVVVDAADARTIPASLANLVIRIVPGDAYAITDDAGAFAFPEQGVDANAALVLDAASAIGFLQASGPFALPPGDAPVQLHIQSKRSIQKHVF